MREAPHPLPVVINGHYKTATVIAKAHNQDYFPDHGSLKALV
jgi:hypothetical protein